MPEVVQIFVTTPSLDEARPFYEDALRLKPERVGETSVEYATRGEGGGASLKVQEEFDDETFAEFGLRPPPEPPARGDGAVFVLGVESIDETVKRVENGVGEVVQKQRSVPWGDRIALVRSPAGYVYELRD
ncbi:VOC family protein [Haladaptatus sp. F3-133]|uniref:VOC family protein n=1 Tax=Halorutilus salinus TaxID=2487751 RepID=A0A9Q4C681_9EURY|nr:VOC family protein [Halorutilus salinus]MCX2819842.1 VOC family protein [Halorutilus salinus]